MPENRNGFQASFFSIFGTIMDYMNTLVWIGCAQALFAATLMFTKSELASADKILTAWLVLLAIEFITCGLDYQVYGLPLLSSSLLLFNPALYLYVRSLTISGFRLRHIQLLHLLPFLIFEIVAYAVKQPFSLSNYLLYDDNYIFRLFFALANVVSFLFYMPYSLRLTHLFRINIHNETASIERNEKIGWLLAVTIFYTVFCIIEFVLALSGILLNVNLMVSHMFNYAVLLILIYMLSFYGLRQKRIPEKLLLSSGKKQYKNPLLSESERVVIGKKVVEYFTTANPFLNADLNMDMLSTEIGIPKHQLTEVLNLHLGKSFYKLVNSYRVEAVKRMLSDPGNKYSIEAIGYDCGFANKSSFFKVFKEISGETPLEFRNRQLAAQNSEKPGDI